MTIHTTSRVPLLDLDLLNTLVAIADSGNFSAAAVAVGRTPSAISMQVKRMEEIVGCPLFVRDNRSVRLTRPGIMLVEHGRRLLALNSEMLGRFVKPDITGVPPSGPMRSAVRRPSASTASTAASTSAARSPWSKE